MCFYLCMPSSFAIECLSLHACLPAADKSPFCKSACLPAAILSVCYQPCLYAVIPSVSIQLFSYSLMHLFLCQPVCLLFVPTCLPAFCCNLSVCFLWQTFSVPFHDDLFLFLFVPNCLSDFFCAFLCQPVYQPICADQPVCLCAPTYMSAFCTNLSICLLVPTYLSAFSTNLSICLLLLTCLPFYSNLPACLCGQPVCLPFCANLPACLCAPACLSAFCANLSVCFLCQTVCVHFWPICLWAHLCRQDCLLVCTTHSICKLFVPICLSTY